MNFNGSVRRPRQVNLGGKGSLGLTRNSALQRAKEDRERRERARREEQAARVVIKALRRRHVMFNVANELDQIWDQVAASGDVDVIVRMYTYITQVKRCTSRQRLEVVSDTVSHGASAPAVAKLIPVVEMFVHDNELVESVLKVVLQAPQYSTSRVMARVCKNVVARGWWPVLQALIPYHLDMVPEYVLPLKGLWGHVDITQCLKGQAAVMKPVEYKSEAQLAVAVENVVSMVAHLPLTMSLVELCASVFQAIPWDDDMEELSKEQFLMTWGLDKVDGLCSKEFIQKLFSLADHGNDAVAVLLVMLYQLCPSKSMQISMHLILLPVCPIRLFWQSFAKDGICSVFVEGPVAEQEMSGLLGATTEWYKLWLIQQLYSYWLQVSSDSAALSDSGRGLTMQQLHQFSALLKNLTFTILTTSLSTTLITALKQQSLKTMRRIYVRDSRRHFLPKDFWIMMSSEDFARFEMSEESNRAEILRQAPFFAPFTTRVNIFQNEAYVPPAAVFFDHDGYPTERPSLEVRRNHEFDDGLKQSDALREPQLFVKYIAEDGSQEHGIDGGGLTKEFLTMATSQGFSPEQGLFVTTPSHYLFPNPEVSTNNDPRQLEQIEFLGRAIAVCVRVGVLVNYEFAPFFLQKCLTPGLKSSFDDLYLLDPQVYNTLVKIQQYEGDVRDLELTFTYANVELKPGGNEEIVTSENRLQYVHAVADYKLNRVLRAQTDAFCRGLYSVLGFDLLTLFNANELQVLISGEPGGFDVEELKRFTVLGGYSFADETIRGFFDVVREMSLEDQALLLKFVTAVPKAPLGGFQALDPKFSIRKAVGSESDLTRLPSASTCANLLKLPDYGDKRVLRDKLLYAIRAGAGFDLS